MNFRYSIRLDVERPGRDVARAETVAVDVLYEHGKWRGVCADPPATTLVCDTLEEALIATAQEITREWLRQSAEISH